jgi:hypothetical protein
MHQSTMRRLVSLSIVPLTLAVALALGGCEQSASQPAASAATAHAAAPATTSVDTRKPNAVWQAQVDAFIAGYFEHYPTDAANAGKHEFDGKLPDWSPAGLKGTIAWLHAQRNGIAAFTDDKLDATQRFQREYVLAVIDKELFWIEDSGFAQKNPAFYADDMSPSMYLTREYAPLPQRMAAFVTYEDNLPAAVAQIRANLQAPLPASYIDYGIGVFGGLADFFENDVPKAFASVDDKALQDHFKTSNAKAISVMRDLAAWLKEQKPHATQDFALGADRFAKMLHATERVDIPLDELKKAGEADLARNLAIPIFQASLSPTASPRSKPTNPKAALSKARARNLRACANSSSTRIWSRFPVPNRPGSPRLRRSTAGISPTSRSPAPTKKGCLRRTTSHRPIRNGRRPNRTRMFRARRCCCSLRRTKSFRATSCSSCMRTARTGSSAACSLATPTPKVGRTTARR